MLHGHVFSRGIGSVKNNPYDVLYFLVYTACFSALTLLLVNPDSALKLFTLSAILTLPLIIKNIRYILADKQNLLLPLMLLCFGLVQIIWVAIFKEPGSDFTAAYRSYQNGGRVMIFSALIVTALQLPRLGTIGKKISNVWIIATAIGLYCIAGYEVANAADPTTDRLKLGFQNATGTAYVLTFIALLASKAIINMRLKYTFALYLLHFMVSLAVIITTQTRAAILVYPLLGVGLFFVHYRHQRTILLRALVGFILLVGVTAIPLSSVIANRYHDFTEDMHSYSKSNSSTSIGARFAMQRVGFDAGKEHEWGQSLEQRGARILALTTQETTLAGALKYVNIHLHNEFIDTFSLKGIPGVIVLLSLYLAMFLRACTQRSALLFVISSAIVIYGLSDVLLYAKGEALSCVLALCAAIMLTPRPVRELSHD